MVSRKRWKRERYLKAKDVFTERQVFTWEMLPNLCFEYIIGQKWNSCELIVLIWNMAYTLMIAFGNLPVDKIFESNSVYSASVTARSSYLSLPKKKSTSVKMKSDENVEWTPVHSSLKYLRKSLIASAFHINSCLFFVQHAIWWGEF